MFAVLDLCGDGLIQKDEFACVQSLLPLVRPPVHTGQRLLFSELLEKFKRCDFDDLAARNDSSSINFSLFQEWHLNILKDLDIQYEAVTLQSLQPLLCDCCRGLLQSKSVRWKDICERCRAATLRSLLSRTVTELRRSLDALPGAGGRHVWRWCRVQLHAATTIRRLNDVMIAARRIGMDMAEFEACAVEMHMGVVLRKAHAEANLLAAKHDFVEADRCLNAAVQEAKDAGVREAILQEHVSHLEEWRLLFPHVLTAALEVAQTVPTLEEALNRAVGAGNLKKEKIGQYRKKLAEWKESFSVQISTLSGERMVVVVERIQSVGSLRQEVATMLGFCPYRISLAHEAGSLEQDEASLEECGMTKDVKELGAFIEPHNPWQELPIADVVAAAAERRIEDHWPWSVFKRLQERLANGELTEKDYRAKYGLLIREHDERKANEIFDKAFTLGILAEIHMKAAGNSAAAAAAYVQCRRMAQMQASQSPRYMAVLTEIVSLHEGIAESKVQLEQQEKLQVELFEMFQFVSAHRDEITSDAKKDLDEILPLLSHCIDDIKGLTLGDFLEVQAWKVPAQPCAMVIEPVCILLGVRPDSSEDFWKAAMRELFGNEGHSPRIIEAMIDYDKDNISDDVIQRITPYIKKQEFNPESIRMYSRMCAVMCAWVITMHKYYHTALTAAPKREAVAYAEQLCEQNLQQLKAASTQCKKLTEMISVMEGSLAEKKLPDLS